MSEARNPDDTLLIDACRHGRRDAVVSFIADGASVHEPKTDGSGATPLWISAQEGHTELVSMLLQHGAAVNDVDKEGVAPLLMASQNGHTKTASVLIAAGAVVNHVDGEGVSPLHVACQNGHTQTARMLIAAGAAVNLTDQEGFSPLLMACEDGHTETASMLLAAGAAVNQANKVGTSPLYISCEDGHAKTASVLLAAGAAINQADEEGTTPLFIACQDGHTETVLVLLAAGAAMNQTEQEGISPLYVACQDGHTVTASALLAARADVDLVNNDGDSALLIACQQGHLCTVQLLSSYCASRQVNPQLTAEDVATLCDRQEVTAWLERSRLWSTPLHHVDVIDVDRARALLRDGADVSAAAAPGGPTPLSLARAMVEAGDAADDSAAQLVVDAAKPWSEATHALFPSAARALAAELLRLGYLLSRQERFNGEETALFDLWMELVVPQAVTRRVFSDLLAI